MNISNTAIGQVTAALVLVVVVVGSMVVVGHGYWIDPNFQVPALLGWVLGAAVTGATTYLGFHAAAAVASPQGGK